MSYNIRSKDTRKPGVGKPYTLGTHFGGSTSGGPLSVGNPGAAGNASVSMSEYWQRSHSGIYANYFELGLALGKTDMAEDSTASLDDLRAITAENRDLAWQAKVDGYREATLSRGPIEFGPALSNRNDEC